MSPVVCVRRLAVGAIVVAALAIGLGSGAVRAGERLRGPVPAEVVRIIDGDTIAVRAKIWLGQTLDIAVRLRGIDTPERDGWADCAAERFAAADATARVTMLLINQEVDLFDIGYDTFGRRVVARVVTRPAGIDLGQKLLDIGVARPYVRGQPNTWCRRRVAADQQPR